MIRHLNELIRRNAYTLGLGLGLGLGGAVAAFYALPVVQMQGELVAQDATSVTLHVWGRKLRGSCRYVGISGYAGYGPSLRDTMTERIDIAESGQTKPAGEYDIGLWKIKPTAGADRVLMYVTHSCGPGDLRVTKIAEVFLKEQP